MELVVLKKRFMAHKFGIVYLEGTLMIKENIGGKFCFRKAASNKKTLYISLQEKEYTPFEWSILKKKEE